MRKCCERFASINLKHCLHLGCVLVSQTSFRGETNDGVGKCRLFSLYPPPPRLPAPSEFSGSAPEKVVSFAAVIRVVTPHATLGALRDE